MGITTVTRRQPVAHTATNRATKTAQQGRVGNRKVSTSDGAALSPIREQFDKSAVTTQTSERTVSLVPDDPTLAPISWFTNRLPAGTERAGKQDSFQLVFGSELLDKDMHNVVNFAQKIDHDIVRASELLEKSEHTPLNKQEQGEVNGLLRAGKYNLSQVQSWTSVVRNEFKGLPTIQDFVTKLQERLADRHMDLADLMCLYDIDQSPPEHAVSRTDRIDYNLITADAALKVTGGLTARGLSVEAKQQLVEVLEEHRAGLLTAKDFALGGSGDSDSVQVLPESVWNPFDLTKGKKTGDSIAALQQHWAAKAAGTTTDSWLPLAHPKLTQEQMLREFTSYQLKQAGVAKKDMPNLEFQFKEATNQTRNELPWEPIDKELHYSVAGKSRTAHSTITPAKAMAGHFAKDMPANGVCCGDRLQYTHVPNLASTELTNASGETLFSALRHGVLDAYDISASNLRKLPKHELSTMVKDLLLPPDVDESDHEQQVSQIVDAIHTKSPKARKYASEMRTAASHNMAKELAVATLVSDPDKLQSALDGKTTDISLSSISLLTPDRLRVVSKRSSYEREMLRQQTASLKSLNGVTSLQVRDASGELRTVKVNCKVRTFNFGVNAGAVGRAKGIPSHTRGWDKLMGWGYSMEKNNPELQSLFGNRESFEIGGEVQNRLAKLEHKTEELHANINFLKTGSIPLDDPSFDPQFRSPADLPQIEKEIAVATRSISTLKEAAASAKQIWREGSYNKGGQDPYKMVSRLGVIINEMGETLAFNCKSGKDRTGQLDAELKYLAARNDAGYPLPTPDAIITPDERQMRSDFTLNTGNLEMQRINTGLPGFKLESKEVPGLANFIAGPEMEPTYQGGSKYISS